jgi:hypothetical protein
VSDLRMNAYYYGFEKTGVIEIDKILSAVAIAGKAYHHTENWTNPDIDSGLTYVELIQIAANEAAKSFGGKK